MVEESETGQATASVPATASVFAFSAVAPPPRPEPAEDIEIDDEAYVSTSCAHYLIGTSRTLLLTMRALSPGYG